MSAKEALEVLSVISDGIRHLLGLQKDVAVTFGIYRVHWSHLLSAFFPALYIPSLKHLIGLSTNCSPTAANLINLVWYDLMNIASQTSGLDIAFSPSISAPQTVNNIRRALASKTKLTSYLLDESMRVMSEVFLVQRAEQAQYGLYPLYKHCIPPISAWCCLTSHAFVAFSDQKGTVSQLAIIWKKIDTLWLEFVYPFFAHHRTDCPQWVRDVLGEKKYLQPWAVTEAGEANVLVSFYAASVGYLHQNWKGEGSILSLVVQKYCRTLADRDIKDHILGIIHTHLLTALPWHHYVPSHQDLSTTTKVINMYLPECHSFLGQVLIQVQWRRIVGEAVERATSRGSPNEFKYPSLDCSPEESLVSALLAWHRPLDCTLSSST